jgi:hypothetical protein
VDYPKVIAAVTQWPGLRLIDVVNIIFVAFADPAFFLHHLSSSVSQGSSALLVWLCVVIIVFFLVVTGSVAHVKV